MPVTLLFVRNRTSTRRAKSGEVEYVIVIPAAVKATLLYPGIRSSQLALVHQMGGYDVRRLAGEGGARPRLAHGC